MAIYPLAKSNLSDHDLFLTYARLLKMRPIHQNSGIRTEAFASNKQEKFGFYGVFRGENTDCLLRKSLRLLRVQFPKEHDLDRSVNSALFYVKDETVLEFCQFYMDEKRRTNHIAHNTSLPTILSNCRCHMISSFQNGLDGGTSATSANVRKSKMLYSSFVDTEYSSVLTVFSLPFLKLKCVFGRVSFPGSLLERRMIVLFTTAEHAFA